MLEFSREHVPNLASLPDQCPTEPSAWCIEGTVKPKCTAALLGQGPINPKQGSVRAQSQPLDPHGTGFSPAPSFSRPSPSFKQDGQTACLAALA